MRISSSRRTTRYRPRELIKGTVLETSPMDVKEAVQALCPGHTGRTRTGQWRRRFLAIPHEQQRGT